jgi:hypothetical protein
LKFWVTKKIPPLPWRERIEVRGEEKIFTPIEIWDLKAKRTIEE